MIIAEAKCPFCGAVAIQENEMLSFEGKCQHFKSRSITGEGEKIKKTDEITFWFQRVDDRYVTGTRLDTKPKKTPVGQLTIED